MNVRSVVPIFNIFADSLKLFTMMLLVGSSLSVASAKVPDSFTENCAEVSGVRLHDLIGGKGSPVVLLHGYAQTSHMWLPIMPQLARHHTVMVPDLCGAGDSSRPESGDDKMTPVLNPDP